MTDATNDHIIRAFPLMYRSIVFRFDDSKCFPYWHGLRGGQQLSAGGGHAGPGYRTLGFRHDGRLRQPS